MEHRTGKKAKRGPELAQRTRAAILNALDVLEERGKPISEMLANEFESNPLKFMDLASKYIPKEISGEVTHTHTAETMTDEQLAVIAAGGSNRATEKESSESKLH